MAVIGAMCGVPLYRHHGVSRSADRYGRRNRCGYFGQLLMSMLIDNFGWFGNETIHFSGKSNRRRNLFGDRTVFYTFKQ